MWESSCWGENEIKILEYVKGKKRKNFYRIYKKY